MNNTSGKIKHDFSEPCQELKKVCKRHMDNCKYCSEYLEQATKILGESNEQH